MQFTEQELKDILDKHQKWLDDEEGGEKADLRYADLRYANLSYADLRSANLRYANLRYANLRSANLRSADLSYADLRYANLSYADLRSANLRYANLSYADLRSANLRYANLRSANLRSADLLVYKAGGYEAFITNEATRIGCQSHNNDEWRNFSDSEISDMANDALEWWNANKEIVFLAMAQLETAAKAKKETVSV